MANLKDLTTDQIQRIIALKEQIEDLQGQINSIAGGAVGMPSPFGTKKRRRRMSATGRAAIAAGAKARWAKIKGTEVAKKPRTRKGFSAATRAKMSAAIKARWKKAKASGKMGL